MIKNFFVGAPGGTRTPNPLVRSQVLYPVELRAHLMLYPVEPCLLASLKLIEAGRQAGMGAKVTI